ncbi:MAG: YfiR family protein [Steroidobacteraceae bacterium]
MRRRCRLAGIGLGALLLLWSGAAAPVQPVGEYELKAVLIFKIAKFVRWPDSAFASRSDPLQVCVIGADPFGPLLDAIEGQGVQSHPVSVHHYAEVGAGASGCHVVFLAGSGAEALGPGLRALAGRPVLTVGDAADFARAGGVVGMRTSAGKLRFEVNTAAAAAQGLEISAQLLQLATLVTGREARP